MLDKTLKLHAYTDAAQSDVVQDNRAGETNKSSELAKKDALLEEEKNKSLELLKTIVQLRESLKEDQVKTSGIIKKASELEAQAKESAALDAEKIAKLNTQLEEEKKKSLEYIRAIEQLRESVKQDQAKMTEMAKKTADLEAKLHKLDAVEDNQLVKKDALLAEEKKRSLEYMRTIEQLRESLKQDQAKMSEMLNKSAAHEAKTKELAMLETRVKDLSGALNKISSIAAAGKMIGDA